MSSVGIPDILQGARLSRAQKDVQERLAAAQVELVTGEARDLIGATNGDPMRLFAIDTEISRIDSRLPLIKLAESRADTQVVAIGQVRESIGELGFEMLESATRGDSDAARNYAGDAEAVLGLALSALNVDVGGRHVFGGDNGDHAPLGPIEDLLADVRKALSGTLTGDGGAALTVGGVPATPAQQMAGYFGMTFNGVSPPTFEQTLDRAFSDPAAAETFYTGGANPAPGVELSQGARLTYGVGADDSEVKALLMQLSAAVAYGEGVGAVTPDEMFANLEAAGLGIIGAKDGLIAVETRLGLDQRRLEDALARNQAERASFEESRSRLVGVDPYEAATRLTELETQLQSIYAMTARTTQLSLLNYL
jgi:flagellar hook-associated protein 3 FlgL